MWNWKQGNSGENQQHQKLVLWKGEKYWKTCSWSNQGNRREETNY